MRVVKHTPTQLKLAYRPWLIWACAALFWVASCGCLVFLFHSDIWLLFFLPLSLPIALLSLYPIAIYDFAKDAESDSQNTLSHHNGVSIRRYSLLGRQVTEYPLSAILAIEVTESVHTTGVPFYMIRLIAKTKSADLTIAPIEDLEAAEASALRIAGFLQTPYRFVSARPKFTQFDFID